MPILVKYHKWRQTDKLIFIQVPLKGIHSSKVDIFVSKKFLKLNYSPFLFELYLFKNIKETESKFEFIEDEIFFELVKEDEVHWDELEIDCDKKKKIEIKENAIKEVQEKTRKNLDEKIDRKNNFKRFAVGEAIKINSDERKRIEELKNKQCEIAMKDFQEWKIEKEVIKTFKVPQITEITENNQNGIKKPLKINKTKSKAELIIKEKHPAPRQGGTISVSFSERLFPTPSRESCVKDEEIWLKKVNAARKASGFISEDLRPEEHNPQWCKDKGDELLKIGNYVGAINAYSHGIKLSDKLPSLFANRAVAYYAAGNFYKCVEDCSEALVLMVPCCQLNLNSRVKCIVRRAAALTRLGMLNKAINEIKYAIKLQPDNEKLKTDLYNMERAWEQNPDSD